MNTNLPGKLRDHVRGTLLGTAVGDALGMPIEGLSHQNVRTYYRGIKGYRDDERRKDLRAGQWTDDTQMTFAVVRALTGNPETEVPARLAAEYLALLPRARRWGPTTRAAVERLRRGEAPMDVPEAWPTNGAAMRAAPLGIWWFMHGVGRDAATRFILAVLRVTHQHPEALVAGFGQAAAVRRALETAGASIRTDVWLGALIREVHWMETLLDETTRACSSRLEHLAAFLHEFPLDLRDRCEGVTVRAASSWPFAVAMFLRNPDLLEATLLSAINVGGDADTVGAMVGALLGARHGWKAFPGDWKQGLEAQEDLLREADAFYEALRTRQ